MEQKSGRDGGKIQKPFQDRLQIRHNPTQEVPQIHLRKRKSVSSEIECSKLTIMVWPGHCVPIFENFS